MPQTTMDNKVKTRFAFGGLFILFLFGFFVWPTLYGYREMRLKDNVLPVRINRITGRTYVLYPSGWREIEEQANPTNFLTDLSSSNLNQLKQGVAFFDQQGFVTKLYNGTAFTLQDINVLLIIQNKDGSEQSRQEYRMSRNRFTGNAFNDNIFINEDIKFPADTPFQWRIISARGSKQ